MGPPIRFSQIKKLELVSVPGILRKEISGTPWWDKEPNSDSPSADYPEDPYGLKARGKSRQEVQNRSLGRAEHASFSGAASGDGHSSRARQHADDEEDEFDFEPMGLEASNA